MHGSGTIVHVGFQINECCDAFLVETVDSTLVSACTCIFGHTCNHLCSQLVIETNVTRINIVILYVHMCAVSAFSDNQYLASV